MSGADLRLTGRILVWTLAMLFLTSGMVVRQGLGIQRVGPVSLDALPRWKMFSGVGVGLTQVRYWQVDAGGEWTELASPRWVTHGLDQALKRGRRLCRQLPPGAELRVEARTSRNAGWRTHRKAREEDLCAAKG